MSLRNRCAMSKAKLSCPECKGEFSDRPQLITHLRAKTGHHKAPVEANMLCETAEMERACESLPVRPKSPTKNLEHLVEFVLDVVSHLTTARYFPKYQFER